MKIIEQSIRKYCRKISGIRKPRSDPFVLNAHNRFSSANNLNLP